VEGGEQGGVNLLEALAIYRRRATSIKVKKQLEIKLAMKALHVFL